MNNETATNVEVIGEVRKSRTQIVRVHCADYNSKPYVYVQLWSKLDGEAGEGESTNRGLTFHSKTLKHLLPLLEKALEVAEGRDGRGRFPVRARDVADRTYPEAEELEAMLDMEARERRS